MSRKSLFAWLAAIVIAPTAVAAVACSGSDVVNKSKTVGGGGNAGNTTTGSAGKGTGGDIFQQDGGGCSPGEACGDGGVCAKGGICCEADSYCGEACCSGGEICSFQTCVTPGNICLDATDCAPGEYCEYGLGEPQDLDGGADAACQGGAQLQTGKCLPKPPLCGPNEEPGDPPKCLESCQYKPPIGEFSPEEKFAWGSVGNTSHNVMMAPIVVQLDDDNCDGNIDERDIPDIVFFTYNGSDYNNGQGTSATLRAISIVDGQVVEKWSTVTAKDAPGRSIAGGDIHTSPGNEVVVCTSDGRVRAYDAGGKQLWLSQPIGGSCFMPSIADMDQDGFAEVIVKTQILDGATGAAKATMTPANTRNVIVSDVNGDGQLDVVSTTRAYLANGQLIADAALGGSHAAVGDLDKDGVPEIVSVDHPAHSMSLWHLDPNAPGGFVVIRQGLDVNSTINPNPCCQKNPNSSGCKHGGGPPTIADFNGDGFPDVGLAGGIGYVVFDGKKLMQPAVADVDTVAWLTKTQDCSSAQTGSSVFDFDGDGKAEVVYADEVTLHIYSGVDGAELFQTCNTSGTLWEYPLVADVDSDGHADIVVASNWYSSLNCGNNKKTTGIRVFGDTLGKWVRTRRIWNQHPYHVTNVNEDGTIPAKEPANYLDPKLNNFRQNVQPLGEFAAPDLVVDVMPSCAGEYGLVGRVRNLGEAAVPPGVTVGFYEGDPANGGTKLGQALTTQTLYSLGSENVLLPLALVPNGVVYAVVADGGGPYPWHECRENNNTSDGEDPSCGPN